MTVNLTTKNISRLEELAHQYNLDANDLLDKALKNYRRRLEEKKIETEKAHFLAQHTELKQTYLHQFVAIHQGQIIDSDEKFEALHQRIRQTYGREAILIRQVNDQPDPPLMIRSPKIRWSSSASVHRAI